MVLQVGHKLLLSIKLTVPIGLEAVHPLHKPYYILRITMTFKVFVYQFLASKYFITNGTLEMQLLLDNSFVLRYVFSFKNIFYNNGLVCFLLPVKIRDDLGP